jgi:hypothetical protein
VVSLFTFFVEREEKKIKKMANLSSTFEKTDSTYIISAPPIHGQNKQLTLLSQCKLAFNRRNVFMALKIRRDMKKI